LIFYIVCLILYAKKIDHSLSEVNRMFEE